MRPKTDAEKVFVKYRCGLESKEPYRIATQRWEARGHDFDIVAYREAEAL